MNEKNDAAAVICAVCGFSDTGRYCSNCGNPLSDQAQTAPRVFLLLIQKLVIHDWVAYFRTVYFVLVRPTWFFRGTFLEQGFNPTNGIATYPNFFAHNIIFIGVLQSIMLWQLYGLPLGTEYAGYSVLGLIQDVLWNLSEIAWFFVTAGLLHLYFKLQSRKEASVSRLDIKKTYIGIIYAQSLLIFVMPFQSLLSLAKFGDDYGVFDNEPLLFLAGGLAFVAHWIYVLHTVPVSFHFAHELSLGHCRGISAGFHLIMQQVSRVVVRIAVAT